MSDTQAHKNELSYSQVFVALVVLTVATLGASELGLPRTLGLAVAIGIAAVKAAMVGLYFMHLRFAIKPVYAVVGFPLVLMVIAVMALMPDVALNEKNARITIDQVQAQAQAHADAEADHGE